MFLFSHTQLAVQEPLGGILCTLLAVKTTMEVSAKMSASVTKFRGLLFLSSSLRIA